MSSPTAEEQRSEEGIGGRPARLTRSRHQRVVAGVAGGLGEYFGVDPVVFRIGFVAVTLLGGSGILLYLIGWLVIPEEGSRRSVAQHTLRRGISAPAVGIALLVIAGVILVHDNFQWGLGRFTLSLLLLALGAALLLGLPGAGPREADEEADETEDDREGPRGREDATEPEPPVTSAAMPPGGPPPAVPPRPTAPPPPPPVRRSRRERPPSPLGRATLAAALVVAGTMGLADATEAIDIDAEAYLATALLVVGLGLLVGAWWGRSRWLIAVGAAVAVVLAGTSAIDVPLRGGFGEKRHAPQNLSELDRELRLFAGEMHIDLTGIDLRERVTEIEASVGFGEIRVDIPTNVRVIVDAEAGAGDISVLGASDEGIDPEVRRAVGPRGRGLLRLHLQVGAGQISVRSA